ncbi:Peroxidase 24 [Linum perenne]
MASTKIISIFFLFVSIFLFVLPYSSLGKAHPPQKHAPGSASKNGKDHGNGNNGQKNGKDHGNGNNGRKDNNMPSPILKGCPQLENIARDITWSRVASNPTLAPKLLRMHFHDCFVRGCDASILLDSTAGNSAEKDALPNLSLAGYEVIDEIKARLEVVCPETVSCADILTLAARDACMQFKRPMWPVFTGRKDGRVSIASEVLTNLPSPFENITTLIQQFQRKGLDLQDLVALSGAHTIGVSRCGVISRRLFNFTGRGDTDPSIEAGFANTLKARCSNPGLTLELDPGSSNSFDAHYYQALVQNQGLLQTDAALLMDPRTALLTRTFGSNQQLFFTMFGRSMVKMGAIVEGGGVEIRKNCRFVN